MHFLKVCVLQFYVFITSMYMYIMYMRLLVNVGISQAYIVCESFASMYLIYMFILVCVLLLYMYVYKYMCVVEYERKADC